MKFMNTQIYGHCPNNTRLQRFSVELCSHLHGFNTHPHWLILCVHTSQCEDIGTSCCF